MRISHRYNSLELKRRFYCSFSVVEHPKYIFRSYFCFTFFGSMMQYISLGETFTTFNQHCLSWRNVQLFMIKINIVFCDVFHRYGFVYNAIWFCLFSFSFGIMAFGMLFARLFLFFHCLRWCLAIWFCDEMKKVILYKGKSNLGLRNDNIRATCNF